MTHQTIQNIENQSQNQQGQQLQSLQTKFLSLHLSNPKSIKQTPPVTSNFPTPINLRQTSHHNFILTLSIHLYLSKTIQTNITTIIQQLQKKIIQYSQQMKPLKLLQAIPCNSSQFQ